MVEVAGEAGLLLTSPHPTKILELFQEPVGPMALASGRPVAVLTPF